MAKLGGVCGEIRRGVWQERGCVCREMRGVWREKRVCVANLHNVFVNVQQSS